MVCANMLILGFFLQALASSSAINPDVCKNDITADCSSQFGLPKGSGCVIRPTSVCETMKLSSVPPLKKLVSEDHAPFDITLSLYLVTNQQYAMNFTLTSHDNDITGFFFFLQQSQKDNYNSCRVFDFTEVKGIQPEKEVTLNYDCYTGLQGSRHYNMTVRATPINQEFNYRVFMPSLDEMKSIGTCEWLPLTVLNTAAISQRIIDLKFSSDDSKPVNYSVMLLTNNSSRVVKMVVPKPNMEMTMHRVVFKDVPSGVYNVAVVPVFENSNCDPKVLFTVPVPIILVAPISPWVYAVVAIAVLVVIVIILVLFIRFQKVKDLPKPKVLMLYSEDCTTHMHLVMKFYEFLKNCCEMYVLLDKWDLRNQDPKDWISDVVQDAQVVIIVISKGVKHKMVQKNEPKMKEESPWGDLFTPTFRGVKDKKTFTANPPQIISVTFTPYTKSDLVPEELCNNGKVFKLPGDLNQFLCYVHNMKTMGLSRFWPVMPGSQYLLYPQGKEWHKALNEAIADQNANPEWFQARINSVGVKPRSSSDNSSLLEGEADAPEQIVLLPMSSD